MQYYYPHITNKKDCRFCLDCLNSCPVQAISYDEEWFVKKEKCKNYQKKIYDICMICMEHCRKKVIQLQEERESSRIN